MKKCSCMIITENCRKIDHVSLFLDMFICLKHFLCTILGNKFDSEILVGWPISKWFYENVIGQTLKKCWFLCCYRPNPPKKNCHSEGILFFSKTLAGTTCLSSKTVFSVRVLINSKFGVFYSNFLSLTPTFCKVSTEKYSKTPTFSGRQHFYSYFQNPSENSVQWYRQCCIDFHLKYSSFTTDSILDSVLSIVKEVLKYDQV